MQLIVNILIATAMSCGFQPDACMPKEAPSKMPSRLIGDFERGKAGDVFSMIRVNQWEAMTKVFSKDMIRDKLEVLAKQGNSRAMLELTRHLPWGESTEKDKILQERSRKLMEQAARLNEPRAMNEYAHMLCQVDMKNRQEAIKYWVNGKKILEAKAKQGDRDAIISLANYGGIPGGFDVTLSNTLDPSKEWMEWKRTAAEFDPPTAYDYGMLIREWNPKEGVRLVEKAANEGVWRAMVEMAVYWGILGVPQESGKLRIKNLTKAWQWLDKATEVAGWEAVKESLPCMDEDEFPKRPGK